MKDSPERQELVEVRQQANKVCLLLDQSLKDLLALTEKKIGNHWTNEWDTISTCVRDLKRLIRNHTPKQKCSCEEGCELCHHSGYLSAIQAKHMGSK